MSKKSKPGNKDISKKRNRKSSLDITDYDIFLLGEGNHFKSYNKLGAHIYKKGKNTFVRFAVWAPHAKGVSIVGEFNDWKPELNKMKRINNSGYWITEIQGLKEGDLYKFAVKSKSNQTVFKADPYAFRCELRPGNASVVETLKNYSWNDHEWISNRKNFKKGKELFKKNAVSIYEVHPGSWKKDFDNDEHRNEWGYKNYRQLARELVEYVKKMNYTHIELLPVMEHPLDISWGYQVVNYFAPSSRYGTPEDFMYFVDYCHQNEIGVILDWVPSHFPVDEHGLGKFDGREIYAYESPLKGYHAGWGTLVFDYGKNEVRNFLISNALFWFEKYHVDGLRVDAVASMLYLDYSRADGEWEPNIYGGRENLEAVEFIKKLNESVHKKHKGTLMIAEESTAWPGVTHPVHLGGLGFDMKWNMGWMHDTLAYFSMDPVYRKFHHGKLTFTIWYAFSEKFLLPISHDEVVHLKKSLIEKMPGDTWQKFANLRLFFGFMFCHPGKKLNFMGNDFAQYHEWNSETSLDWNEIDNELNRKLHFYFNEINALYCSHAAMHELDFDSRGFQWLDFSDSDNSVIAFARYGIDKNEVLIITFNMTPVIRYNYEFGVPEKGFYKEILNSDSEDYGGSGIGNLGGVHTSDIKRYEFPYSIKVTLPPLAVNIYKYEKYEIQKNEVAGIPQAESGEEQYANEPEPATVTEKINIESEKIHNDLTLTEDDMEEKMKEIIKKIKKF